MKRAAIELERLRIELTGSGIDVVDEISLRVRPGEVLGLVGESGSGKTTVGMALLGYTRRGGEVSSGSMIIDGEELTRLHDRELRALRGSTVSYIPQDPGTALNPALRIGTQLSETLEAHAEGRSEAERKQRIREVLEEVALPSDDAFLRRYPHQLSGGQQQRVAITMAFANRPKVIVCDEPTTGLDVTTQARVLETIRELSRSHGVTALYISHDLAVVAELADQVAVMYGGRIVEQATCEQLFSAPRHPYTARLLRAIPDLAGKREVVGIPGHAPMPGSRPQGCSFHPRCPLSTEECEREFPPVTDLGKGHAVRCYHSDRVVQEIGSNGPPPPLAEPTEGDVVLAVRGLNAHYGSHHTLFDVDLRIRRRECLALVGESGSGKTTLALCVAGLHRRYTGEVALRGNVLPKAARQRSAAVRKDIQYVFQNPYASLNPRRSVGQIIARQLQLFFQIGANEIASRVGECLERVALPSSSAERYPDQLSGGERQRVAVARALAAEPSLLVCDEVTSALDVSVQAAIIDLLRELHTNMGLSLLFITHNLALVRTIADQVAVMTEGRIVENRGVEELFTGPQADYTRHLLQNTPSIERALEENTGSTRQ